MSISELTPILSRLAFNPETAAAAAVVCLNGFPTISSFCCKQLEKIGTKVSQFSKGLSEAVLSLPDRGRFCFPVAEGEKRLQGAIQTALPCILPNQAGIEEYGNKFLNLIKLSNIERALSLESLHIPLPRGISHDQTRAFLHRRSPEIFANWARLKQIFKKPGASLNDLEVSLLLKEIDQAIERSFASSRVLEELGLPQEMLDWLQEREANGEYLMVRSTGAEDSKQLANAGGNVSKAYIPANPASLAPAIGEVVRSYFGAPSLQNRLNAGLNPFNEELALPVLVQQLIGEPIGGALNPSEIPVSFVLFTNEPLYIGDEQFRVLRLSASYGHGESVVGNTGVATDTALILRSESKPDQIYYLYDNKEKRERLAPIQREGEVRLEKIPNPVSLQKKAALSPEQLLKIYPLAVAVEGLFDNPTDIEGVFANGKVHFVQARPVNRKPLLPTYLNAGEQNILARVEAEALVTGKASVVKITSAEEVLFAPTLQEAERLYHPRHKLIVVLQSEPENSHPVVNFSSLAVPCLYAQDGSAVQNLLRQIDEAHPLAACMQTGTLNLWGSGNLDDSIIEGFAVHPAKISRSLSAKDGLLQFVQQSPLAQSLIKRIRSGNDGLAALVELESDPLLLELKEKSAYFHSKKALAPQEIVERIEVLEQLETNIVRAIEEMRSTLLHHPKDKLRRLLFAKNLETQIGGSKSLNTLSAYSLADAKPLCRSIGTLLQYQEELGAPAHCLSLLAAGEVAPSEKAFESWRAFLMRLEPLIANGAIPPGKWERFQHMISTLQQVGALPHWLTFFQQAVSPSSWLALFQQAVSPSSWLTFFQQASSLDPVSQLDTVLNQLRTEDQGLIDTALQLQQSVRSLKGSIERFSDPQTFPSAWSETLNLPTISSDGIKNASPITQAIIGKVLQERVDFLDTAAKTLKASPQFPSEEKAGLFKEILRSYYEMMRDFAQNLVLEGAIPLHREWPIPHYLTHIGEILENLPTDDSAQLLPSRAFSVSAAMLGSRTDFERHMPQTLEDMLTLLHQNCLACLNAAGQQALSSEMIANSFLPQAVKEAMTFIETQPWGREVQRVGIETGGKTIVLRYNVPLRNHSGHLDLSYDISSKQMVLTGQLLGEARTRWTDTAHWIADLENAGLYQRQAPTRMTEQELVFQWKINPENLSDALGDYAAMAEYSLDGREAHFNLFERLKNKPEALDALMKNYFDNLSPARMMFYREYIDRGENLEYALSAVHASSVHEDERIRTFALRIFLRFVDKGVGLKEAFQAARENSVYEGRELIRNVLNLFGKLVDKGIGSEEAIQIAREKSAHEDPETRINALELFGRLVDKGMGHDETIQAARENSIHEDGGVRMSAFNLFYKLVDKGIGFAEAIQVARENAVHEDPQTRGNALELFGRLVDKGIGFEEALQVARENSVHEDESIRGFAFELFGRLIDKGIGSEEFIQLAKENSVHKDEIIRSSALYLFERLIDNGIGFEEAIQAARESSVHENPVTRRYALYFFLKLLGKERGFNEAIQAAKENFSHENGEVRIAAVYLFHTLLNRGRGFEEAIETAKKSSVHEDFEIRKNALAIFENLLDIGIGFNEAIQAAKENSVFEHYEVRIKAFSLLGTLIDKGKGFDVAVQIAKENFSHGDASVREEAANLFEKLVDKGVILDSERARFPTT